MANPETTDLVARLRECAAQCDQPTSDLYALAADEIERLRVMLAEFYTTPRASYFPIKVRFRGEAHSVLFSKPSDLPNGEPFVVVEINCNDE